MAKLVRPFFVLRADNQTLNPHTVKRVELYAGVDVPAPYVVAVVEDMGQTLKGLSLLTIGTEYTLYVVGGDTSYLQEFESGELDVEVAMAKEPSSEKRIYKVNTFVLAGSSTKITDTTTGACSIELALMHQAVMYKDAEIRAFGNMSTNGVHMTIVERLKKKEIIDKNSKDVEAESTPTSILGRYKVGLSDFDYLVQEVFPILSKNGMPAYGFINEFNKYCFHNVATMFENNKSTAIRIGATDVENKGESYGVIYNGEGVPVVSIGGKDFQKQVKCLNPKVLLEHFAERDKMLLAVIGKKNKIGKKDSFYPVRKKLYNPSKPTDFTVDWANGIGELVSKSISKAKVLDKLILAEVDVEGAIFTDAGVGCRVDLLYDIVREKSIKNEDPHWISGGWVIFKGMYRYKYGDSIKTHLEIARPTVFEDSIPKDVIGHLKPVIG